MKRRQIDFILKDLAKKMVFLTGPRQVGKTWLAKEISQHFSNSTYLNYDNFDHQRIIKNKSWLPETDLLILDELHKMPNWKNYLKGLYDTKEENLKILVTGSARLETFRNVGDSLAGRYFLHRLLPFSLAELENPKLDDEKKLIHYGGFPEPFLSATEEDQNRWRLQYVDGLIRYDVLDFERIHDFKAIQGVLEILRRSVGSQISYKSIAEDLAISPHTAKKYIQILEELFIVFRVSPYSKNISRSLLKEPKIYFFDSGMVIGDEGAKCENYVAVSLLKHLYEIRDYKGLKTDLKYLKTKEGHEVDFCLVVSDQIDKIIECKLSDGHLHKGLKYFCGKYKLPGIQLVKDLKNEEAFKDLKIEVRKSFEYLKNLSGLL